MKNVIIEASAGTGKTQALAERLIALLKEGVKPREIVALTFSRAAAGEIFERFVTLLAERAETDAECAALLRETIATQHLSQIGTLDSFLARVLRAFPLESGLAGEIELMDEFKAGTERSKISFSILRRTDEKSKRGFVDAFALAMNHEDVRAFTEAYRGFIAKWHELCSSEREESAWGDPEAIWGGPQAFLGVCEKELAAAADALEGFVEGDKWREFQDWIRGFRGSFTGMKGFAKAFLAFGNIFSGESLEVKFGRKTYFFDHDRTLAVRTAFTCVFGYVLRRRLELARGIYRVVSAFEKEYDARVRRRGRLVFADVPRLIAGLPPEARLALEYRLDARIRAWALDEFQDTSREQWRALENLVDEAKQSADGKSVFVVGDTKQAIYGWRNGDVGIFEREKASGMYEKGELVKTYRSGPAIVEAVNRVFASGMIENDFPAWKCPEHASAKPDAAGWVSVVEAPGKKMEDFIEPVYEALKNVDPAGRSLSAAVLVRNNAFGEALAAGLRARGMRDVVWEGESAVLDTVALAPFLDLVQLSEHPGDMLVYRHFSMSALARAKYPAGVPSPAEVSREMTGAFTTKGLVRTLRDLRALLPEDPEIAWSRFTETRFVDMLRAAAEFELSRETSTRLSDFPRFLEAKKKRNLAEPGKTRIMTIHRSKGLGFDYVVLPLYEPKGLSRDPDGPLVEEGRFVLPDPGAYVAENIPGLSAAFALRRDRAEQEALCGYYVAMTRAKAAMTIVTMPPAKSDGAARRFSDYVREAIGATPIGEAGRPLAQSGSRPAEPTAERPTIERGARVRLRRRVPSKLFHSGMSAGDLFAPAFKRRETAKAKGTAIHAEYEKLEFLDPAAAQNDIERALVKPDGFVELWRERSYEILADGVWESGQFDRVVFTRDSDGLRAVIYDYKTNRLRPRESAEEFAKRLNAGYSGQMASYRRALSALTGIAAERIETTILAVAAGLAIRSGSMLSGDEMV